MKVSYKPPFYLSEIARVVMNPRGFSDIPEISLKAI